MRFGSQALRRALRSLARTPGFALVVLATLALGIGATTAIFTVVRSVLLRDLPFEQPDQLVDIGHLRPDRGAVFGGFSPQDFDDLRAGASKFTSVASYFYTPGIGTTNLTGQGEPLSLAAAMVDGRLFSTLGVAASHGRVISPQEDAPGANQVVVLSDAFWRRRLGADPAIVGRTLQLDGRPFQVLGVMPPSFTFPASEVQVWLPISLLTDAEVPHIRGVRWMNVVGRLAPGITAAQAEREVGDIVARLARSYPESNEGWNRAAVQPIAIGIMGDVRAPLTALLVAVALVLLIACVNAAHLMLARGLGRRKELAIRAALGASRSRLVGQLLLESGVLVAGGAALGLFLAWLGVPALAALAAGVLPRTGEIAIDSVVVGFAFVSGVAAFLIVGVMPALRSAGRLGNRSLVEGRGQTAMGNRLANGLLALETGFAVLLLCGTLLTLASLWKLTHVDAGFRAEPVVSMRMVLQGERWSGPGASENFRRQLLSRLADIPGVVAAGGSKRAPLTGGGEPYALKLTRNGGIIDTITPGAGVFMVTPAYFASLSIPLLAGREFLPADTSRQLLPVIVSRALAAQAWPGADPVGQSFQVGPAAATVVGVVADVHARGLAMPAEPAAYVPLAIFSRSSFNVFVKVTGSPLGYVSALRAAVREIDPDMPISDLGPLRTQIQATTSQPRLFTMLIGVFGATALLLAVLGIYGVVAQGVSQRQREIGIRMALGARSVTVVRLVVGAALTAAAVGAAVGLVVFLLAGGVLRSQLYQMESGDPLLLALAPIVLLAAAWLAAWLPARRAARVDPMIVLRIE
ncbi:MAG: ABC transporter permease [Gemmatimonadota bacterium]